jgi:hypothetical protein
VDLQPTHVLDAIIRHEPRLRALRQSGLLDTPPEEGFDRLTRLVCRALKVPVALVSLVDADRQFFKSAMGLPEPWAARRETPLGRIPWCATVLPSPNSASWPISVCRSRYRTAR